MEDLKENERNLQIETDSIKGTDNLQKNSINGIKKDSVVEIMEYLNNYGTYKIDHSPAVKILHSKILNFYNSQCELNAVDLSNYDYFKTISTDKRKGFPTKNFLLEAKDKRFLKLLTDFEYRLKRQIQIISEIKQKYTELGNKDLIDELENEMTDKEINEILEVIKIQQSLTISEDTKHGDIIEAENNQKMEFKENLVSNINKSLKQDEGIKKPLLIKKEEKEYQVNTQSNQSTVTQTNIEKCEIDLNTEKFKFEPNIEKCQIRPNIEEGEINTNIENIEDLKKNNKKANIDQNIENIEDTQKINKNIEDTEKINKNIEDTEIIIKKVEVKQNKQHFKETVKRNKIKERLTVSIPKPKEEPGVVAPNKNGSDPRPIADYSFVLKKSRGKK